MTAIGLNKTTGTGLDSLDDHIRQSISDIITTPVGTRVMRREYGSIVPDLVDQPMNRTTLLRVYAATAAAVMRWEPRFRISRIQMAFQPPAGALVEISGRLANNAEITANITLGGGA
jgi:phage baseplate assembly protein W